MSKLTLPKITLPKITLPMPANALAVGLGATLIFGYGAVSSLANSLVNKIDRKSSETAQVQPTSIGKTIQAQLPPRGQTSNH